jgi:hypothetical protein
LIRVNSESVSNKINKSDLQYEKHDEQRMWIWEGSMIFKLWPNYQTNRVLTKSKKKSDLITTYKLYNALEIDRLETFENAEP